MAGDDGTGPDRGDPGHRIHAEAGIEALADEDRVQLGKADLAQLGSAA